MELSFGFPKAATDAILTFFIAAITIGGLQSIARVASGVIPFMAFSMSPSASDSSSSTSISFRQPSR